MEESGQKGSVVCIRMHTGFESGSGFIVGSIATATVLVGSHFIHGSGATSAQSWRVGF